jgi:hypothetical protein
MIDCVPVGEMTEANVPCKLNIVTRMKTVEARNPPSSKDNRERFKQITDRYSFQNHYLISLQVLTSLDTMKRNESNNNACVQR